MRSSPASYGSATQRPKDQRPGDKSSEHENRTCFLRHCRTRSSKASGESSEHEIRPSAATKTLESDSVKRSRHCRVQDRGDCGGATNPCPLVRTARPGDKLLPSSLRCKEKSHREGAHDAAPGRVAGGCRCGVQPQPENGPPKINLRTPHQRVQSKT